MNQLGIIQDIFGKNILLIPCRKGSKKAAIKWGHLSIADMANPAHVFRLEQADNVAIVLGRVSGGLCSIDIDDDDWVEPFLQQNPALNDTACTQGARGCNFWVRIKGEYPRTHHIKSGGVHMGEFRADGGYTVVTGIHPTGCEYRFVNEANPIEMTYESIILPDSDASHVSPPTSSLSLNTQYSELYPTSSILYNNGTPASVTDASLVLERIEARKAAEALFRRIYRDLEDVYGTLVESRFRAIAGGRNAFLVEAVPFLYRAVATPLILPLVRHFYLCNQPLFSDPLATHMQEAQAMMAGVAATYLQELSEGERGIYLALDEREQDLFRIFRDLSRCGESEDKPPLIFYVPLSQFAKRLGLAGMQVQRDTQTLISYGIIELVEKGEKWQEGKRPKAGRYLWLLA